MADKKKDVSEEVEEPVDADAGQDKSIKTYKFTANQGATKDYWSKSGKRIPGAKAGPVESDIKTSAVGLGAVAAAAKKKREDQAAALAGKK